MLARLLACLLASIQPRTSPIISRFRALGNLNLNFEVSERLFAAQQTFAERALADDDATIGVLHNASYDLCRARGVRIHEHYEARLRVQERRLARPI